MNRLFVDLYLDEDVDVLIGELVQARGFSVLTTRDAGNLHVEDEEQLRFASQRGLTILTHNRVHFERLAEQYVVDGASHAGIIIARRRNPYEICRRLLVLLNAVTADEICNQIRYI